MVLICDVLPRRAVFKSTAGWQARNTARYAARNCTDKGALGFASARGIRNNGTGDGTTKGAFSG
jgi:hypothetical protein